MLQNIQDFLSGKKTYIAAGLLIVVFGIFIGSGIAAGFKRLQ
jgi:type IV secretory pathway VirB2 component (pilin)